jgi:hypothetical protein
VKIEGACQLQLFADWVASGRALLPARSRPTRRPWGLGPIGTVKIAAALPSRP